MVPTFTYPFLTPATQANFSTKKLVIFPTTLLTIEGVFCISHVKENKQNEQNVLRVWWLWHFPLNSLLCLPYNEIRQNRFISELLLYFCVTFMLSTDWSCYSYELNNIRFFLAFMITRITGYSPFARDHNAPCLPPPPPPKFLTTIVPVFSWVLQSP